jgi:RAB protein geranylgeranyltransferase component A
MLNRPSALSKAGVKVAHLDHNSYYGGDEASLTLDELARWADDRSESWELGKSSSYLTAQRAKFTSISRSGIIPDHSRHYSISLAPPNPFSWFIYFLAHCFRCFTLWWLPPS